MNVFLIVRNTQKKKHTTWSLKRLVDSHVACAAKNQDWAGEKGGREPVEVGVTMATVA